MARNMETGSGRRGNPWSLAIWGAAAFLLLLPFVAMQFTREVDWTASDFLTFGIMLFAACGTYELAARTMGNTAYRAGVGVAVAAGFLLVWVNLAVGIIGSEANAANLMFAGVLAVGIVSALAARFEARGMARAMVVTAIAQVLVAVIALMAGLVDRGLLVTVVFVAMWLASAGLFRKAAQQQGAARKATQA